MTIFETYDYLVHARRDLWAALEAVPDEVLSRPLLQGKKFHCLKDLVFHSVNVEDAWIHYTILRDQLVLESFPNLKYSDQGSFYASYDLRILLDYWQAVEKSTLAYLATLTDNDLKRIVDDSPTEAFVLDSLLWHVMIHEIRHTAQIVALLRTQGIKPPSLDLLWYLPNMKGHG
ncbi:MAG: DinB family protein [Trueperaceae bacterium]